MFCSIDFVFECDMRLPRVVVYAIINRSDNKYHVKQKKKTKNRVHRKDLLYAYNVQRPPM